MTQHPIVQIDNLAKVYTIDHLNQHHLTTLVDRMAHLLHPIRYFKERKHRKHSVEEFWALKGIDLSIAEGDRLGVIGKNGAGKSTLLKILSRITEPTRGKVTIRGRVASLLEVGTGFHPELTGRENIFLNGAILGMSKREITRNFDAIVAFAEVEKFLDTPVKRFSSGMFTRLGFAIAAHLQSDVLIVDEVLAVGDYQFQKKCLQKMNELGSEGRTILFVSHDVSAVLSLCNKGILLDQGEAVVSGPVETCVSEYLRRSGQRKMTWEGDLGDEHIRFTAANVNPSGDREYFTHGEEATLAIEYEVTKPHPDLIIGFGIWNQRNQLLARSSTSDAPQETAHLVEKGKHTVSFPINPNLFHEGEYCIKLDCQLFRHKNILNDDILLKFPIFAPKQETRFSTASEKEGINLGNSWSRT